MTKTPNHGAPWSKSDLRSLKSLARKLTIRETARKLGRTQASIQQKAIREGVSFR